MHQFDRLAAAYARALGWVMARSGLTMLVFAGSVAFTALLFWGIPKNLFPTQDTGQIRVTLVAAQDISFTHMAQLQQQVAAKMLEDPGVESLSSSVGVDGTNTTVNQGRMVINLKPISEREGQEAIMASLRDRASGVAGFNSISSRCRIDHRHRNRPDALSLCAAWRGSGDGQHLGPETGQGAEFGSLAARCQRAGAGRRAQRDRGRQPRRRRASGPFGAERR
jgi:multidrug efflux pump subunit AcrB